MAVYTASISIEEEQLDYGVITWCMTRLLTAVVMPAVDDTDSYHSKWMAHIRSTSYQCLSFVSFGVWWLLCDRAFLSF
jgi:hypothetical protein